MSLVNHEIGLNLIQDDEINYIVDRAIGKLAAQQHVNDRINADFNLTNITATDLIGRAAEIELSSHMDADVAKRLTNAAEKAPIVVPGDRGDFWAGASNQLKETKADDHSLQWMTGFNSGMANVDAGTAAIRHYIQAANIQRQREWAPDNFAPDVDLVNTKGFSRYSPHNLFDNSDSSRLASELAQAANLSDVHGSDSAANFRIEDLKGLIGEGNLNRLINFQTVSDMIASSDKMAMWSDGDIVPKAYQAVLKGIEKVGSTTDDGGFSDVGEQRSAIRNLSDISESGVLAELFRKANSSSAEFTTSYGRDSDHTLRGEFYPGDAVVSNLDSSSETSILKRKPSEVDALADTRQVSSRLNSDPENIHVGLERVPNSLMQLVNDPFPAAIAQFNNLDDVVNRLGDWTKFDHISHSDFLPNRESPADTSPLAHGYVKLPIREKMTRDGSFPGDENGEASSVAGDKGVLGASSSPGWLVALITAAVGELSSRGFHDPTGTRADLTATKPGQIVPNGTRNNPIHVKIVDQLAHYGTHMPAGPTSSLPSQSLPIPGQVLFSP